jgi:crotonobetainyl-CoA:carnitine CoA-transferase CaiB-like acyl-CoA transferase
VSGDGPLAGVRILDLTRLLPGGVATGLLADLGADVVKIEQPGVGDYMRWGEPRIGAESAASWVADRNKRSVALDLKQLAAVEALKRLAQHADALIEGFRPGVVDRLGVGYEALRAVNPRLVYCSLTGYGQDGPLAAVAGHDLNYIGRAGVLGITGEADGPPSIPGVQIGDVGAGAMLSALGLVAAVLRARDSGIGDHVDVSMTDGAFAFLSVHLGDFFASGVPPERGRMALNGRDPCYNVYRCADGRYVTVGAARAEVLGGALRGSRTAGARLDAVRAGGDPALARAVRGEAARRVAAPPRAGRRVHRPRQRLRGGLCRPAASPPRNGRRARAPGRRPAAPGRHPDQAPQPPGRGADGGAAAG